MDPRNPVPEPRVNQLMVRWFTWYARRYLRGHFNGLRLSRNGWQPGQVDRPLVLFSNHASWWDALIGVGVVDHFFPQRRCFAPIDAAAVQKYRFFLKLGFFGVEQGTRRGAATFLRTSETILRDRNALLWVTPQGRFGDVRERPLQLRSGLGHLAARAPGAVFCPLAIEYVFWEERLPEVLLRFGEPVATEELSDASAAASRLTRALEHTQDQLAAEAILREPSAFAPFLEGKFGVGGIYDYWRQLRARLRREPTDLRHASKAPLEAAK